MIKGSALNKREMSLRLEMGNEIQIESTDMMANSKMMVCFSTLTHVRS